MLTLPGTLKHWNSAGFDAALKSELVSLADGVLPLQQASTHGGMVDGNSLSVTVISSNENPAGIAVRVGIFFTEIVGGCSCGDEPFETSGYCVLDISLDKSNAEAHIVFAADA